jgi:hypothetical protein
MLVELPGSSGDAMQNTGDHGQRIDRVEGEVSGIRADVASLTSDVTGLKIDVKGLGGILGRIEAGVNRAQEQSEQRATANKPNVVAIVSILITIITVLVGGAWVIGGSIARGQERSEQTTTIIEMQERFRNREMDQIRREMSYRGGAHSVEPTIEK